jgi:hypothetical protein
MAHPGENPEYVRPDDPRSSGMNKGTVASWDLRVNPMEDTRLDSFPSLQQDGFEKFLYRGYMKTATKTDGEPLTAGENKSQYWLFFRYNPSSVSVNYALGAKSRPVPGMYLGDQGSAKLLGLTGGSLSFSLLFDRTYEMSDPSQHGTWAGDLGVLADSHVIYNMVGMNEKPTAAAEDTTDTGNPKPGDFLGVMQLRYVWVNFMNPRNTTIYRQLPAHSSMRYFGYVTSISMTYTHFTQRMAPTRGAFTVNIDLMTVPAGVAR